MHDLCRNRGRVLPSEIKPVARTEWDGIEAAGLRGAPFVRGSRCRQGPICSRFPAVVAGNQPPSARTVTQRHGDRWLVCNPPGHPLGEQELDAVYALPVYQSAPSFLYRADSRLRTDKDLHHFPPRLFRRLCLLRHYPSPGQGDPVPERAIHCRRSRTTGGATLVSG